MSIKQRLTALERKAYPPHPWLILDINKRPTDEQQAEMDEAERTGRVAICFERSRDTAWIVGCGEPAPWEVEA